MNQPLPDPDEEKARQILAAFRQLERQERLRVRMRMLMWLLQLLLVVAVGVVFISNLKKFKLLQELVTRPDSLLQEQPGTANDFH